MLQDLGIDNYRGVIALVAIVGILATLIYIVISDASSSDDQAVASSGLISHRYAFEHKYFKLLLFDDPYSLFQRFVDYGEGAVIGAWNNIGVNVPYELVSIDKLHSDQLATFIHKHKDTFFVTIKMPKPQRQNECYYIGLILPNKNIIESVRYITLEQGTDATSTCLNEWTNKGIQISLAESIIPRIDVFEQLLVDLDEKTRSIKKNNYNKQT